MEQDSLHVVQQFCGLCLHLIVTSISTSKSHFEKENNVYIDNLQAVLTLREMQRY